SLENRISQPFTVPIYSPVISAASCISLYILLFEMIILYFLPSICLLLYHMYHCAVAEAEFLQRPRASQKGDRVLRPEEAPGKIRYVQPQIEAFIEPDYGLVGRYVQRQVHICLRPGPMSFQYDYYPLSCHDCPSH